MKNIEVNFYSGFESNDGVILLSQLEDRSRRIIIWNGFYKEIIDRLEPMIDDELNDLIRCYDEIMMNLDSDNKLCQVLNLKTILIQLQNLDLTPDTRTDQIYYDAENRIIAEMIILISEAIDKQTNVYMQKY
jgi:hypothetical protein